MMVRSRSCLLFLNPRSASHGWTTPADIHPAARRAATRGLLPSMGFLCDAGASILCVRQILAHHREAADLLEPVLSVEFRGAVAGPQEPRRVEPLCPHRPQRPREQHGTDAATAIGLVDTEGSEALAARLGITDDGAIVLGDVQRDRAWVTAEQVAHHARRVALPVREMLLEKREQR